MNPTLRNFLIGAVSVVMVILLITVVQLSAITMFQRSIDTSASWLQSLGYTVLGAGVSLDSDVLPSANNTYDVGSSSYQWAEGHFNNIYTAGTAIANSGNFTTLYFGDGTSQTTAGGGRVANYIISGNSTVGYQTVDGESGAVVLTDSGTYADTIWADTWNLMPVSPTGTANTRTGVLKVITQSTSSLLFANTITIPPLQECILDTTQGRLYSLSTGDGLVVDSMMNSTISLGLLIGTSTGTNATLRVYPHTVGPDLGTIANSSQITVKSLAKVANIGQGYGLALDSTTAQIEGVDVFVNELTNVAVGVVTLGSNVVQNYVKVVYPITVTTPLSISTGTGTNNQFYWAGLPIGARVRNSADQTVNTGSTAILAFDTEMADSFGMHSGSSNNLTVVVPGYYSLSGMIYWSSSATGMREATITVNGVVVGDSSMTPSSNGTANIGFAISNVGVSYIALNVGDYIQLKAYQNSGGALLSVAYSQQPQLTAVLLR